MTDAAECEECGCAIRPESKPLCSKCFETELMFAAGLIGLGPDDVMPDDFGVQVERALHELDMRERGFRSNRQLRRYFR